MNIKRFVSNPIGENCYVVWDDTREAAIIDCGMLGERKEEKLADYIVENSLVPRLALQTHMHFDHIFGLPYLHRAYGLQPLCHAAEQEVYDFAPTMSKEWFGMEMPPMPPVKSYLADGQVLKFGNTSVQVLYTPGHTPGGVMFYFPNEKVLFSGDTLFQGSVGRADFPGSSMEQEIESIRQKVLTLPDDVKIFPGHGPETTVGEERQMNPYL